MDITLDQLWERIQDKTLGEMYQNVVIWWSSMDIDIPDVSGLIWIFVILGGGGLLLSIGGSLIGFVVSIFQFLLFIPIALCKIVFYPFQYFIEKRKRHTTNSFSFTKDKSPSIFDGSIDRVTVTRKKSEYDRAEFFNPSDGLGAIPAHRSMGRSKGKSNRSIEWATIWSKKCWKWILSSKEDNEKGKKT